MLINLGHIFIRAALCGKLLLSSQLLTFLQPFDFEFLTLSSPVHIAYIVSHGLEVATRIVASAEEDVVARAAVQRLIDRDRWTHELFLDLAKTLKARLQLEMMV
jgi:hypothetical protein